MKKSYLRISIFVLLMSICACCFISLNKSNNSVYAAAQETQNCYYLLEKENTPYLSTQAVGKIEGSGEFVVGTDNLVLTATAYRNYQLVGWQVVYNEQGDRTEFIGTDGLVDNSKTIKMAPLGVTSDENKVDATLAFSVKNGYFTTGTFTLSKVFEDLTIRPVFDHIYYQVNINDLVAVSTNDNVLSVGSDTLYYDSSTTTGGVTTYTNAYFKIGENYYYYGEVESDGTNFYTVHKTLEATPREQKTNYSNGAFRFGDEAIISFDIDITSDIKSSKNIDLQAVTIKANNVATPLVLQTAGVEENCYSYKKDAFLRTSQYSITTNIFDSTDYINTIGLSYHNLFVVDLKIFIDGSDEHSKHAEIFGDLNILANDITGNVSFYNFYSRTKENNLQFLIKNSTDNNSRAFGLNSVSIISKTIDGKNYDYYKFESLNGLTSTSQYFGTIDQNVEVSLSYTSVEYNLSFQLAEYVIDAGLNAQLIEMDGNSLDSISLKRGESVSLTTDSVAEVVNIGYRFVGFTYGNVGDIQNALSYVVDEEKPASVEILLCYQKIEYDIIFTNFNTSRFFFINHIR